MTNRIAIDARTHLLVLTGAGVSAESGLATFRDAGGLWEGHRVEQVASPQGFRANPTLVWNFYSARRAAAATCHPNAAHEALAEAEARLGERFLLVTQNVDGLHHRAGSKRVLEIHGTLFETKCFRCDRPPFADAQVYEQVPECELCAKEGARGLLRPNIVWFGEALPPMALERVGGFAAAATGKKLVFLAVGTSGVVWPAAGLVEMARAHGAETWLLNAERAENTSRFDRFVQGKSAEFLPKLFSHGRP